MPQTPFSLVTERWIPVRRASGRRLLIAPCEITDGIDTDPVVAIDWLRPDFRAAMLELWIALYATACPPADNDAGWFGWWQTPPSPATLKTALKRLARAFVLDGDGPRFMQDAEPFLTERKRPETLLIDVPGEQTLDHNADHFVKRHVITTMSRAAAAMALYTLQSFAPTGGAGMRVSVRGGGPLSTLAHPPWPGVLPLWHLVWANVPVGTPPEPAELPTVFPWLAPTRISTGNRPTTPNDGHPLQAFWGMPRRIRLEFAANAAAMPCDLMGIVDPVVVRGWHQRQHGAYYIGGWFHPLSPYYRPKASEASWLAVHARADNINYRHWLGWLFDDAQEAPLARAASAIRTFRGQRLFQTAPGTETITWRLFAAGYEMDKMKALAFIERDMPVLEPGDPVRTYEFVVLLRALVLGADEALSLLKTAMKRALNDAAPVRPVQRQFWSVTEPLFLRRVAHAAQPNADAEAIRRAWLRDLATSVRRLFAEAAPIDASGVTPHPERIATAARDLNGFLMGYRAPGKGLYRKLGLPPPEKVRPAHRPDTTAGSQ